MMKKNAYQNVFRHCFENIVYKDFEVLNVKRFTRCKVETGTNIKNLNSLLSLFELVIKIIILLFHFLLHNINNELFALSV